MILIGIGANLPGDFGSPLGACEAAIEAFPEEGMDIVKRSPWYESAPVPVSDQPWFVNGVALVKTDMPPEGVLAALHRIENRLGRKRSGLRNEARILDLDLLDYNGLQMLKGPLVLPHPRMHERSFVLLPLQDVVPDWQHPVMSASLTELIARLPDEQEIRPV